MLDLANQLTSHLSRIIKIQQHIHAQNHGTNNKNDKTEYSLTPAVNRG